jgi:hypothetical protein
MKRRSRFCTGRPFIASSLAKRATRRMAASLQSLGRSKMFRLLVEETVVRLGVSQRTLNVKQASAAQLMLIYINGCLRRT